MRVCPLVLALGLLVVVSGATTSSLRLPHYYSSHMVLQHSRGNMLWGWTDPGKSVEVTLDAQPPHHTTADAQGKWAVVIPVGPPGGPHSIVLQAGEETKTLTDVLFGDVYLCSGQSNMEFTVNQALNASAEVADADHYPNLRLFTAARQTADTEQEDVLPMEGHLANGWGVSSSQTVGADGEPWTYFSAVCYFFGREIHKAHGLPVGVISTTWGGTYIQAWSSPDALAKCPEPSPTPTAPEEDDPNRPSVLYNAMLHPFLPLSLRGIAWYQAENNVGTPKLYTCLFPALIADWRAKFHDSALPFFFVQVSTWNGGGLVPKLRIAQMSGLALPNTAMAVAMDTPDPQSPWGDIHPRNKQLVAHRLARAAHHLVYHEPVVYRGPTVAQVSSHPNGLRIHFENIAGGLVLNTTLDPSGFELHYNELWGGSSWVSARATLDGKDTVVVEPKTRYLRKPTAVRYAWADYPICSLYSNVDLPAECFQMDARETHRGTRPMVMLGELE